MEATYELFEHTADLGVRVRAANLPDLLAPATAGLYACIGTLVPVAPHVAQPPPAGSVRPGHVAAVCDLPGSCATNPAGGGWATELLIERSDPEPAMLLHDFLSELLQLFDARLVMATAMSDIVFGPPVLSARVTLAPVDRQRSDLLREVKAVTYHALEVQVGADGCTAQFIVDI
jgi:SHS2 domain-containing protein